MALITYTHVTDVTSGYSGNQQPRNNDVSHKQTGTRLRDNEGRQLCRDGPQNTLFLYILRFGPWTRTFSEDFCLFVTPANNNAWIIQPMKRHLTESMNQVFGLQKLDSREQTFRPTADKQYKSDGLQKQEGKESWQISADPQWSLKTQQKHVEQKRVCQGAFLKAQADQTAPELDWKPDHQSDESTAEVFWFKVLSVCMTRSQGEFLQPSVKHGGGSVVVQSCFSQFTVTGWGKT